MSAYDILVGFEIEGNIPSEYIVDCDDCTRRSDAECSIEELREELPALKEELKEAEGEYSELDARYDELDAKTRSAQCRKELIFSRFVDELEHLPPGAQGGCLQRLWELERAFWTLHLALCARDEVAYEARGVPSAEMERLMEKIEEKKEKIKELEWIVESPCEDCEGMSLSEIHNSIAEELNCERGKDNVESYDEDFATVYEDGSVTSELVTGALRLQDVARVLRKGIRCLEENEVVVAPDCCALAPRCGISGAGGHQTYSIGRPFSLLEVQNVFRLVRRYFPALLAVSTVRGSYVRDGGTDFRKLYSGAVTERPLVCDRKYHAVHAKEIDYSAGTCRLLEFRWPDSHTNIQQIVLSTVINQALILEALRLSAAGELEELTEEAQEFADSQRAHFCEYDIWCGIQLVSDQLDELLERLHPHVEQLATCESVQAAVESLRPRMRATNGCDVPALVLVVQELVAVATSRVE